MMKRIIVCMISVMIITFSISYFPNFLNEQADAKTEEIVLKPKISISDWIIKKQPKLDPVVAKEISSAVKIYSDEYNLPPELVICIIERESSFRPIMISKANCKGLMQINEKFHKEKLKKFRIKGDEIYHIRNNVRVGCAIMKEYYDKTKSVQGALTKYLGAENKNYINDILSSFADMVIIKES